MGGMLLLAAAGLANAGISTTKHNLGSGAPGGNNKFDGTAEICVFCHTPHAAASNNPPLWNKALPTGSYNLYDTINSSTIDGEVLQPNAAGNMSVSIACLSCHDGSQAMNNFINAPGSGGYNAAGANMAGTWTSGSGTNPVDVTTGQLAARTATTGVANLGSDLRDDHPIGIRYCGGGPTQASPTTACTDGDFFAPSNSVIGGQTVFWVDTGGAGRQKTDLILYNRTFTAGVGPSVECASCHDPHTTTSLFLRLSNANSALCLTCHNK
ncbi:MAG: cytochrome c3 family protein [Betaproteobacteria bacterium]|nr:cytochrome c3 family protein [Betaproteobacteria bacterium]